MSGCGRSMCTRGDASRYGAVEAGSSAGVTGLVEMHGEGLYSGSGSGQQGLPPALTAVTVCTLVLSASKTEVLTGMTGSSQSVGPILRVHCFLDCPYGPEQVGLEQEGKREGGNTLNVTCPCSHVRSSPVLGKQGYSL